MDYFEAALKAYLEKNHYHLEVFVGETGQIYYELNEQPDDYWADREQVFLFEKLADLQAHIVEKKG